MKNLIVTKIGSIYYNVSHPESGYDRDITASSEQEARDIATLEIKLEDMMLFFQEDCEGPTFRAWLRKNPNASLVDFARFMEEYKVRKCFNGIMGAN